MVMCGSRKYPYPPHGRDLPYDPPLRKFQFSSLHCFKFLGLSDPPPPPSSPEFPIPSVGGVWIFSGTTQYDFFYFLMYDPKQDLDG